MEARIEDRLKRMIVECLFLKIAPGDLEEDKSLIDTYGVDSVSLLELVMGVEKEFGIDIGDEGFEVKHFETVTALADFVRSKI